MLLGVVVAVVAALLVIGAVVTYRMARSNDTVESFRRQIDALVARGASRRRRPGEPDRRRGDRRGDRGTVDAPDVPDARPDRPAGRTWLVTIEP